jgi:hypothetical protein
MWNKIKAGALKINFLLEPPLNLTSTILIRNHIADQL